MANNPLPLAERVLNLSQVLSEDPLLETRILLDELTKQWLSRLEQDDLLSAGIAQRRQALFRFFYQDLGFVADNKNYYLPAGSNLSVALIERCGGPMILGTLLLHLAKISDISLDGIDFPGHFLLSYIEPTNKRVYFDPYSQEILNLAQLAARLKGTLRPFSILEPKVHLKSLNDDEIIQRLISVNKASYIRCHQHLLALRCNEMLLKMEPNDPYEIRDRGFLFEQLDCHQLAAKDYKYFMTHCPDDPTVPLLKLQMQVLNSTVNVLH